MASFGQNNSSWKRAAIITAILLAALALFGIGIGVGIATGAGCEETGPCLGSDVPQKIIEDADPTIHQRIIEKLSKENIRTNLRYIRVTYIR